MGRNAAPPAPAGRKRKGSSFPPLGGRKRRLIPAPAAQPVTNIGGWASLPDDIAHQVAARVLRRDVVDYIAFRAVCSGWRACTPSPRDPTLRIRTLRPVAWVALCDGDSVRPDDACEVALFNCQTARCLRVRLPDDLRRPRYRIIGFTDGLVILLHKRSTAIRVLHPFTRVVVDFPSLAPVYQQLIKNRNSVINMSAAVCTSVSSPATSIAVVVWFPYTPVVLSADAGHPSPSWEVIHQNMELLNTLSFQGRLYGVIKLSRVVLQVYPPLVGPATVVLVPHEFGSPHFCDYFLVESDGHMLLVVRSSDSADRSVEAWRRHVFGIFKVNVSSSSRELTPVSSLGSRALFLSIDRCLSVSAKDLPCISSDSLYLSIPLPYPVFLYSLRSRSIERPTMFCQVHDLEKRVRPSVRPFTLADHLLTYCNHRQWSNGHMFHEYYLIPKSFEELRKKIRSQYSEVRISRVQKEKMRCTQEIITPPCFRLLFGNENVV